LKQVCGETTIVPNPEEGEAGYTITADPYDTLGYWQDDLERWRGTDPLVSIYRGRIMTFMAGRAAEEEFLGSCAGGDRDDQRQIDLMLDSLLPSDADLLRYAQRLRGHTRTLVRARRRQAYSWMSPAFRTPPRGGGVVVGFRLGLMLPRMLPRADQRPSEG
jgi:hypothetical protein